MELSLNITENKKQEIQNLTTKDPELSAFRNLLEYGWPNNIKKCLEIAKFYFKFKNEISCVDNLITINYLFQKLHDKKYWKNFTMIIFVARYEKKIEDMTASCDICCTFEISQGSEPLMTHSVPRLPWNKVAADIFHLCSESYLLIVDYYSKFVEVVNLNKNFSSQNVINKLKSLFSRFGITKILVSDNDGEFSSFLFKNFAKEWAFQHVTFSPLYPVQWTG